MGQALKAEHFPAIHDPETMAARVMEFAPATDSEALKLLRTPQLQQEMARTPELASLAKTLIGLKAAA